MPNDQSPAAPLSSSYSRMEATAPDGLAALLAMGKAVDASGLEKSLTELVKLRVSQINGCAFCTGLHLRVARRAGVASEKLDMLAAWHDAPVYSPRERAALFWAEHVTKTPSAATSPDLQAALTAEFDEAALMHLTLAIANINAWNRLAGALHFPPMQ